MCMEEHTCKARLLHIHGNVVRNWKYREQSAAPALARHARLCDASVVRTPESGLADVAVYAHGAVATLAHGPRVLHRTVRTHTNTELITREFQITGGSSIKRLYNIENVVNL